MEIIQLANRGVRLRLFLRQNAVHKHFDVGILDVLRVCNAGFGDVEYVSVAIRIQKTIHAQCACGVLDVEVDVLFARRYDEHQCRNNI